MSLVQDTARVQNADLKEKMANIADVFAVFDSPGEGRTGFITPAKLEVVLREHLVCFCRVSSLKL